MRNQFQTDADVTVGTDWTTILSADRVLAGEGELAVEIANTGAANALSDLKVQLKPTQLSDWHDYLVGTDADFGTVTDAMQWATASPHTCAAGATAAFMANIHGAAAFRLQAKVAADTTTVSATAMAS